ncbi:serine protease 27-like [Notechis scutatus]|uniref:Serine protease 27-like n=1 Tax=Notechis scutatus TaxID=8663 RepID=A0A6J1UQF1_9SAUR|nr:serine protease 27-like [Notechis scutatus]
MREEDGSFPLFCNVQVAAFQEHLESINVGFPVLSRRVERCAAKVEAACGQPVISRIVGGQAALEGTWPWQVSIFQANKLICGGSLISSNWVISAAHCFNFPEAAYEIQLGAYKLLDPSPNMVTLDVKRIISHPDYTKEAASSGDIALVELNSPVTFNNYILPICLPASSVEFPANTKCWVTGWGQIGSSVNLASPQILQELEVPIIDRKTCNNLYNISKKYQLQTDIVKADMICAGYKEGGKDACQGDSGGPLVCKSNGVWTLAGVVSWGEGCAQPNQLGIYTSVPFYLDWIQSNINSGGLSNFPRMTLLLLIFTPLFL